MYGLKKNGKVLPSKFVGTGPSSYKKKEFTGPRSHKGFRRKLRTIENKLYVQQRVFFENRAVYELMWENIVQPGRTQ